MDEFVVLYIVCFCVIGIMWFFLLWIINRGRVIFVVCLILFQEFMKIGVI